MKLLYRNSLATALIFSSFVLWAQNNSVSIGTTSTNSSAVLWLASPNGNQGFIIPVGDRTKVAIAAKGMLIFDTNQVYYHDGTIWNAIGGSGGKTYTLTVNASNQLVLSDGTTSTPVNVPIAGDVTGTTLGSTKVTGVQGKTVTLPSSGIQYLSYDATQAKWVFQTPSGSGDMLKATYDPNNKATDAFDITKHTGWPTNASGVLTNNGSGTLSWTTPSGTLPILTANQLLSNNGSNVGITVGGDLTLSVASSTGTFTVKNINGKPLPAFASGVLTSDASGNLSWAAASGTGTVTNVSAAGGTPLSVTSPSTAPVISITPASTSTDGYLKSADWNTFNGKVSLAGDLSGTAASPLVSKLNGKAIPAFAIGVLTSDASGNLTWAVSGSGTVTNVSAAAGTPLSVTTPTTTPVVNITAASTSTDGYLKKADWNTFNGKVSIGGDLSGTAVAPTVSKVNGSAWPANAAGVLTNNGTGTLSWGTTGTVSSVGLALPALFTVTGSPVTTSGTLTATLASQTANTIFAAPNAAAGAPSFRTIVLGDLPTISIAKGGTGATTAAAALTNLGALGTASTAGGDLSGTFSNLQLVAGTIVDADVSSGANISGSKINPDFVAQTIATTGQTKFNSLAYTWPTAQAGGSVLTNDGTGALSWALPGSTSWSLLGNGGTSPGTNFIGTTDAQDLVFKTSGVENARITTAGSLGLGISTPSSVLHVVSSSSEIFQLDGASNPLFRFNESGTYKGFMQLYNNDFIMGSVSATSNVALYNGGYGVTVTPANNVGIGMTTPSNKLEAAGNIVNSNPTQGSLGLTGDLPGYSPGTYPTLKTSGSYMYFSVAGNYSGYIGGADAVFSLLNSATTTNVFLNTAGASYLNGGNVGIGTFSPGNVLDVNGGIDAQTGSSLHAFRMHQNGAPANFWYEGSRSGDGYRYHGYNGIFKGAFSTIDGTYSPSSDKRLKKNIESLGSVTERLLKLRPTIYHMNEQHDSDRKRIGFIAQEVLPLFPEFVEHDKQNDLYSLNYSSMIVIAIKAIQEQQEVIDKQKAEIEKLKTQMEEIRKALGLKD